MIRGLAVRLAVKGPVTLSLIPRTEKTVRLFQCTCNASGTIESSRAIFLNEKPGSGSRADRKYDLTKVQCDPL